MASIRTVLLAFTKVKPLVGDVDAKFENKGIEEPVVVPPLVGGGTVM
jgi:hypothetical protein